MIAVQKKIHTPRIVGILHFLRISSTEAHPRANRKTWTLSPTSWQSTIRSLPCTQQTLQLLIAHNPKTMRNSLIAQNQSTKALTRTKPTKLSCLKTIQARQKVKVTMKSCSSKKHQLPQKVRGEISEDILKKLNNPLGPSTPMSTKTKPCHLHRKLQQIGSQDRGDFCKCPLGHAY